MATTADSALSPAATAACSLQDRTTAHFDQQAKSGEYDAAQYMRQLAADAAKLIVERTAGDDAGGPPATFLDIGCGTGLLSEYVAPHFKLVSHLTLAIIQPRHSDMACMDAAITIILVNHVTSCQWQSRQFLKAWQSSVKLPCHYHVTTMPKQHYLTLGRSVVHNSGPTQ